MVNIAVKQISFCSGLPSKATIFGYQTPLTLSPWGVEPTPSNTCSLNVRYVVVFVQFFGWTPIKRHRASPLCSYFFLNVKSELFHPAPSRAAALDQAICDCIFCAERSNICPSGNTGRVLSNSLVERLRLFDGACKARLAFRGRTLKLFTAWAAKSSHGSFDFYWGKKSARIFNLLPQTKNRTSRLCAGAQPLLCPAGADHSSKKPSRLNALRVAERNFTLEAHQ